MKTLAVIPARGGSKSIPRKNIVPVGGRPLIAYTIDAALQASEIADVVVSTDDAEIAEVCATLGLPAPFMRPAELSHDLAPSLPVVKHALEWAEGSEAVRYDAVILLQPTTPFRTAGDIDTTLRMLRDSTADSVISVVDVGAAHPFRMKRIVPGNRLVNYIDQGFEDMRPRQLLPPVYLRSGAIYASRRDVVMTQGRMVGDECLAYVIPAERALNIDSPQDLLLAQLLVPQQGR